PQPRAAQPDTRPAAQPRPAHQPRPERSRERQPEGGRSGFADNVPAFLRKPVKRPVKVAGE
ncbi:MAG: DEAD/DEAH box helicase, partial [Hyphomicrobium sp.]|nr:DEAD/DEAH box helicase [Hyphomicrobium sp.]